MNPINSVPALSIVIPTFNRPASLQRVLESIAGAVREPAAATEVLVVNNSPKHEVSFSWRANPQGFAVTVLTEAKQGKAHALNLALAKSRGRIILILDDDVVAEADCLAKHLEAYASTAYDALQGKILPGQEPSGKTADFAKLREYNIPYIDYGDQIRELRGLTGTNMSFKREVFEKVGFFDTRLGPGAAGFSEDTEYSIRIRKAGFKIGYTPHAVVYHELNPNRYGREYNRMVEYRKGLSRSIYRHDSIAFRVLPNLLANCVRYGVYRLLGNAQKAYKTEGRIAKCWGYLNGKMHGVQTRDKHSEV